ncbi:twin-arginine translocase TatA/TatE family subunit [Plantibacter sp. Mn2098]|uniref:twin-arginine translocase TatA/TatE family subunit n=1 Tax=Plantibacter sp. Mn2098 TaxID=3395266 RepID=UPI003BCB0BB2
MFGLTFDKLLIIGVIAVFLLGPDRLPHYAAQLGRLVRTVRDMATGAKDRMREEMGPEFDEVDWKKLDPRQYDPRRIIREALLDDSPAPAVTAAVDAEPVPVDAAPAGAGPASIVAAAMAASAVPVPVADPAANHGSERRKRIAAGETILPPYDGEAT